MVTYVAANNAPVLIRNSEIIELPKDKMPVGKGERTESFSLHSIDLKKGDSLYLYTDGYADQFGGPKGKKFKYQQLKEKILAIANSPLVKTAIAGEDANWGRIVMAIGKSGEKAIRDKLRVKIGGILVAAKGMKDANYKEADIMPHMKGRDIKIEADIGVGKGVATVWTCDLTHRYIDINGSYRS